MKISLITPAAKRSRAGNRRTADRWARILRDLGHKVEIGEAGDDAGDGSGADIMIAIHAWRSHASIRSFSDRFPDRPLIVLLAGTDIYRYQHSHPAETIESMERADILVCLHELVHRAIPDRFAARLRVILQSAPPLVAPRRPSRRYFEVCVVGHLRDEKDSLRAARAARQAPAGSRLRVVALGSPHDEKWAAEAAAEAARNPRFVWRGEVPGWQVRRQFARSHAMVVSSRMEGGANVVSEAVAAGLPVLASRIDGNVGLLGEDYDGYYRVADTGALAALLDRAERDPAFLPRLEAQCRRRQPLFSPDRERAAWRSLLAEVGG